MKPTLMGAPVAWLDDPLPDDEPADEEPAADDAAGEVVPDEGLLEALLLLDEQAATATTSAKPNTAERYFRLDVIRFISSPRLVLPASVAGQLLVLPDHYRPSPRRQLWALADEAERQGGCALAMLGRGRRCRYVS